MNDILENSTGIKSEAEFSKARAQTVGAKKVNLLSLQHHLQKILGLIYKF